MCTHINMNTCTKKQPQTYKYVLAYKHKETPKTDKLTGTQWSNIYRDTNNEQNPKVSINWISKAAVTSLTLPVPQAIK